MSQVAKFSEIIAGLGPALMPTLQQAYDLGRKDERERIERAVRATADESATLSSSETFAAVARAVRRVPSGTVRPLVQQVLRADRSGVTKTDIARRVAELNADIAATSVINELQRNENTKKNRTHLYRRRKDLWFMLDEGLPETEGPAVADDDRPAGSMLNGNGHDETTITTSG